MEKFCPECGARISANRTCSECGKRFRKKDTPASITVMIISIIFLAGVCFYVFGGGLFSDDPTLVTLEEFNAIQSGMTYNQVCNIIGAEGELSADGGSSSGEVNRITMYTWYGSPLGSNALITFIGGRVDSKAQSGL